MRDETKAAIVIVCLLALALLLTTIDIPNVWRTLSRRAPAQAELPPRGDLLPPNDIDEFVDRYGPPTFEEQSSQDRLHPPMFTKWLDYEPEHLRVAFVAATGEQTSVTRWILVSFVDSTRTQPISPNDAGLRLRPRLVQVTNDRRPH
jgi:hypothetical protein